jgi:AraC-like DNA-binding protein
MNQHGLERPPSPCFAKVPKQGDAAIDILSQVLEVIDLECRAAARYAASDPTPISFSGDQSRTHILLRGAAEYQPGPAGVAHKLYPGDVLVLTRRERHELKPLPTGTTGRIDTVWLSIDFHVDRLSPHPLAAQMPQELLLRADEVTDHAELLRTAEVLETELINHQPGEYFIALHLSDVVVVAALRRQQRVDQQGCGFLSALANPAIHQALAAIHGEPARRWQVSELAREAQLSEGTFSERFHRLVGEPPMRYVRLWRLLTARRLIAATPLPISHIAAQAGYSSSGGFSRAFRRQFALAPSSLRRGP